MTHPTITKEQVDALLKTLAPVREPEFWTKLCQAVYKLGRNAGLEEAAQLGRIGDRVKNSTVVEFVGEIYELKDNTL